MIYHLILMTVLLSSIGNLFSQTEQYVDLVEHKSGLAEDVTGGTGGELFNQIEPAFKVVVESEEIVYRFQPAENGASPMWCYGNTCIVRHGKKLFASGIETIAGAKPNNNVRWMLFENRKDSWELLLKDTIGRTREPCPLGIYSDGSLFLSVNPTLTEPGTLYGPALPQILEFSAQNPTLPGKTILPIWDGNPEFREHSYRSFAIDRENSEMILFQNNDYSHAEWAFFDSTGTWSSQGKLVWPWGESYEKPQPIRICYPAVQLSNRAVHFLGVSDIVEPKKEWRDYKFDLTGRKWDYDFRRLFYINSTDIRTGEFQQWVEIATREKTAGHIFPCDLWISPDGLVHILWIEHTLDERLQKAFFPDDKQSFALNYAILRNGKIIFSNPIMSVRKEESSVLPGRGKFHITPDMRLFVIYFVHGKDANRKMIKENRIVEIGKNHQAGKPVRTDLEFPLRSFFTAGIRGGNAPSYIIDILGKGLENIMRYTRIRIVPE